MIDNNDAEPSFHQSLTSLLSNFGLGCFFIYIYFFFVKLRPHLAWSLMVFPGPIPITCQIPAQLWASPESLCNSFSTFFPMHPTDLGRLPHFAFKNEWQTDSVEKEHVKIVWEQMVHVPVFPRGERCTGVTDLRSTELSRQKQCHKSLDLLAAELSRITQESAHLFSKSFPDSC